MAKSSEIMSVMDAAKEVQEKLGLSDSQVIVKPNTPEIIYEILAIMHDTNNTFELLKISLNIFFITGLLFL